MDLSAVADNDFIDAIAVDLGIPAALVEKDWYVVQVLRTIAEHTGLAGHVPVFGGGTSLSKGFGIIKRLSEDIDFKVIVPQAVSKSAGAKGFSACRTAMFGSLRQQGLTWSDDKDLLVGKGSTYFQVHVVYPRTFDMPSGFRPELKIEVTFEPPRLATVRRQISSFIALVLARILKLRESTAWTRWRSPPTRSRRSRGARRRCSTPPNRKMLKNATAP